MKKKEKVCTLNPKKKDKSLSLIRQTLLTPESINDIVIQRKNSLPYEHLHIHNMFNQEKLRAAQEEAKYNLTAEFKESDLFKVFQTMDLGNLTSSDKKTRSQLSNLMNLKEYLYGPEFRKFVCDITGVEGLTDRVDCSMNIYTNGCHLLCHDDVIGTRRVSYIIYLTDPDEEWTAADGGALELFPLDASSIITHSNSFGNQGIPTAIPTTTLLPTFNSMVIFAVQPGRSYHAVQEVFSDKPRMSISGWYHGETPPIGSDLASLKLIMKRGDDDMETFHPIITSSSSIRSSSSDSNNTEEQKTKKRKDKKEDTIKSESISGLMLEEYTLLSQYINPEYLKESIITNVNTIFCEQSSMQLKDFLHSNITMKIQTLVENIDNEDKIGDGQSVLNYDIGTSDIWGIRGPAHKRRYLHYIADIEDNSNIHVDQVISWQDIETLINTHLQSSNNNKVDTYHSHSDSNNNKTTTKEHKLSKNDLLGYILYHIQRQLFQHPIFIKYIQLLTSLKSTSYRSEIRRFRPGLDYSVAYYGGMTIEPRLDATLCFVKDSNDENIEGVDNDDGEEEEKEGEDNKSDNNNENDMQEEETNNNNNDDDDDDDDSDDEEVEGEGGPKNLWSSGDVGGFECYIEADGDSNENTEAAEVYQSSYSTNATTNKSSTSTTATSSSSLSQELKKQKVSHDDDEDDNDNDDNDNEENEEKGKEDSSLLSISPRFNVLNLVLRDHKVMRFIKYISANAPSSRWDISVEYQFEHLEDDE